MYRRTPESEPERRTSPLALRISILTAIAIAIFSVLFLRLWYVQILSGDKYRTQANDNRIRQVRVQAPRGDILDRNGKVMVANRTELAVEVNTQDLPAPGPTRSRELHLLSTVTGMSMDEIRKTLASGSRAAPGGPDASVLRIWSMDMPVTVEGQLSLERVGPGAGRSAHTRGGGRGRRRSQSRSRSGSTAGPAGRSAARARIRVCADT